MMTKPRILLLFTVILISACEKDRESFKVVDTVPVYPRGDINRFYQGMDRSPDTVFLMDAEMPVALRTASGVILEVPAGAFGYQGGESVSGPIRLQWKVIKTIYDQVARRISQGHQESILQPTFCFEILADKEGVPLELFLPVTVKWPDNQPKGLLALWYGRFAGSDGFLWAASAPGSISISSWVDPVLGSGTNGYFFAIDRVGIVNVANEQDMSQTQNGTVESVFFPAYNRGNTAVWFLEKETGRALALRDLGQGYFQWPVLSKGTSGRLFCVTEAVRQRFFSATLDITLLSDTLRWEPRPNEQPVQSLHQMIASF